MIHEPVLNAGVIRGGFMNLDYFGQQCSEMNLSSLISYYTPSFFQ